jgi:hypothetical protein
MSLQKVWEKADLPRGDLQLLDTCHPSGVLRLTQSNYGIDQTTYFRDIVFSNLTWRTVYNKEMAAAAFNLVINGQHRGVFNLEISHKPSWESNQNNYTTGLHWGDAVNVIQDNQLAGRTLTLYKADNENFDYQIVIN